jgi:predicted TIM-barrel fold metal-dependent hydrolase
MADADPMIRPISADSHIVEPPECFLDFIDPAFRERAPKLVTRESGRGDAYIVEGFPLELALNTLAAAGKKPEDIRAEGDSFSAIHRSSWDPSLRLADQDADGVGAEIIYPTIGMLICNVDDADYKNACMHAYNRWLQTYVATDPKRLIGLGQSAIRSVAEAVEDFRRIKEMGFKGVMMPGRPATEFDYDDPQFDPLWRASIELDLPISFHILTSSKSGGWDNRGPYINGFQAIIRGCQDIIGMFIYSGVFMRHPALKLVCVEADAGWAPHYMYRMDHAYKRHRFWNKAMELERLPSEYFRENVYLTFQDDLVAFNTVELMNPRRLLWANDFPHSDSTWPWSQQMLSRQTRNMSDEVRRMILRDNVVELYDLPVEDDLIVTKERVVTL